MPYNKEKDVPILISRYHHKLLQEIKAQTGINMRFKVEQLIEAEANKEGILELRG